MAIGDSKTPLMRCQFFPVAFARWQIWQYFAVHVFGRRVPSALSGNGKESFNPILDPDAALDHPPPKKKKSNHLSWVKSNLF